MYDSPAFSYHTVDPSEAVDRSQLTFYDTDDDENCTSALGHTNHATTRGDVIMYSVNADDTSSAVISEPPHESPMQARLEPNRRIIQT